MKAAIERIVRAAFAILALAGPALASPGARTITGRVASIADHTLAISTKQNATVEVRLVSTTRYLKWVTRKPLQRDTRADRSHLRVGSLVAVHVELGEPLEARLVRIG